MLLKHTFLQVYEKLFLSLSFTSLTVQSDPNLVKPWTVTSLKGRCGVEAVVEAEVGGTLLVDLQSKYYASQLGWAF